MWIVLIIIAIVIGAIIGYANKGDSGEAVSGAIAGGMGCGYVLLNIFLFGIGIAFMLWLFSALFG